MYREGKEIEFPQKSIIHEFGNKEAERQTKRQMAI
jgi:hypothetical protein